MRRVPFTGGEKESLHVSLDRHRDAVLWKVDGSKRMTQLIDAADGAVGLASLPLRQRGPMSGNYGGYDLYFALRARTAWTAHQVWADGARGGSLLDRLRFGYRQRRLAIHAEQHPNRKRENAQADAC